eukprot:jgi/Phyca11/510326/fgenesh2_kg.PHYCAscaffold_58_\
MDWLEATIVEKDWKKAEAIVQQIFIREQSQVVAERKAKEEEAKTVASSEVLEARDFVQNADPASSVWIECRDESSGATYYCNQETGETSWKNPSVVDAKAASDWREFQDSNGSTYYYNLMTGETTWTLPA